MGRNPGLAVTALSDYPDLAGENPQCTQAATGRANDACFVTSPRNGLRDLICASGQGFRAVSTDGLRRISSGPAGTSELLDPLHIRSSTGELRHSMAVTP
jgi:hypothetical protein